MATEPDPFAITNNPAPKESDTGGFSGYQWLKGFGLSAAESLPELIGYTPSTGTQQFRQDNPVSGFLSEIAGTSVPYLGWFKAAKYIPKLPAAIEAVGGLVNNPIAKGALTTAAELAPFEAGRVALSQSPVGGDKSFTEMLGDAGLNLAAGAGIGGLVHGVAAAGVRDKAITQIFPNLDINVPYPLQARKMKEIIDSGVITDPDSLARANGALKDTLKKSRLEELSSLEKYVAPIAHDVLPDAKTGVLENQLEAMFKTPKDVQSSKSTLQVRRLAQSGKDFSSPDAWQAVVKEAGLPQNFEQEGQYFRQITFNSALGDRADRAAQGVNQRLTRNMVRVADNAFISREADDGMYIVAKKTNGSVNKPDAEDSWVVFKTDSPGKFLPDNQIWNNSQIAMSRWTPGAKLADDGGETYNALKNGVTDYPLNNIKAISRDRDGIAKLLPQNIRGTDAEVFKRFGDMFKEYFAPRQYQFRKSARANWIMSQVKLAYDASENLVNQLMSGEVKAEPGKNLFWQSLRNDKSQSTFGFDPIRDIPPEVKKNWDDYYAKIVRPRLDPMQLDKLAASGDISPEAAAYFKNVDAATNWMNVQTNLNEKAVAKRDTEFMKNTYGLPRIWEGDTRIVIRDPNEKLVGLASGPNRKAAQANAQALLRENPTWVIDGEYSLSDLKGETNIPKWPKNLDPLIRSNSWQMDKQGLRGFQFDTKPPTTDEFLKAVEDNLRGQTKNQASMSVDDVLSPAMDKLLSEDPAAHRMVQARMNDYAGIQSPFSHWQNRIADKVLAPMMGTNSASKIVQYTNTALFNFQLGALRLAYPVVNALQFVQTVNPEVAFVLGKAPNEALAPDYSHFAAGGTKGPVGGMAVLSPLKLMGKSVREMAKPSPELTAAFQRASNDRVIDPRVVEEYVGASGTKVADIRKLFTGRAGEVNFPEWLRGLSEFMPAFSERISRTHAFTTGYIMGRDFLERGGKKLSEEQIYQFARQFTEKTMYLYSAADKPRVFTTPAGSLMGLFKNWMFNYMGQMGQYTNEAFMHNNWAPLMWQTGGTFALGGLSATPLMFAADKASQWFTNKSAMENAYEQFGAGGDAMMLGLPAALTGISLYSNVNTPTSNPTRDAASLFSIAAWDRVKQMGNLAGVAFDKWQTTGEHPGQNAQVRELLMRSFAPATVYRTMSAFASPEQITQLGTGYPLIKDVPPAHQVLYAMGFNPTELDRGMAISQELHEKKTRMNGMVKKLGDAWSDAETRGDGGQMALIMRQATVWGVDVSSVIRSGMRNLKKMREDIIDRQLTPKNMGAISAALKMQRGQLTPEAGEEQ